MIEKYFRILLWKVFKFEKWHISLLSQREYAQDIIKFANSKNINSIVEIGVGLGDIIRNIKASYKLCLDLNKAVLKANKFLSFFNNKGSKKIEFKEFDIFKNNLDSKFDMIIMVNWIHNIEANLLNKRFQKFISSNLNRGYLVFDVLENKDYKYNHNPEELLKDIDNIKVNVSEKVYEYGRRLVYVKKN